MACVLLQEVMEDIRFDVLPVNWTAFDHAAVVS